MSRDLAIGQIYHQYNLDKKLLKIYTIISVTDGTAVCAVSLPNGKDIPGRVLLPDNPLCRRVFPQTSLPLED